MSQKSFNLSVPQFQKLKIYFKAYEIKIWKVISKGQFVITQTWLSRDVKAIS